MKFTVNSSQLNSGLSAVVGAVPGKATLPILETILFTLDGNTLKLTATDLEIAMIQTLDVDGQEPGSVSVPAKRLLETLRQLPDTPLTFAVDDQQSITFSTDKGTYKLVGESGDDFPGVPDLTDGTTLTCESEVLKKAVQKTLFAVSNDDLRPAMMGVFFTVTAEGTTFVATDGHRLVKYHDSGLTSSETLTFIVPEKALNQVLKSIHSDASSISVSDSHVIFEHGDTVVISRLINEQYPNYESVIPKDNDKTLFIDRETLLSTVKRVSVFSSTTTRQIRLQLGENSVVLRAEDLDLSSEAKESLSCDYDGETMEIGFNARYLGDVLSNIDHEQVRFEFSTPNRAGIVKPATEEEGRSLLMLVMPVMLNTY